MDSEHDSDSGWCSGSFCPRQHRHVFLPGEAADASVLPSGLSVSNFTVSTGSAACRLAFTPVRAHESSPGRRQVKPKMSSKRKPQSEDQSVSDSRCLYWLIIISLRKLLTYKVECIITLIYMSWKTYNEKPWKQWVQPDEGGVSYFYSTWIYSGFLIFLCCCHTHAHTH